jgi:hypothetical protein
MSPKYVLYKRVGSTPHGDDPAYIIQTQLAFGEIVNRASETASVVTREVIAENDDLRVLQALRKLARGIDDE